MYTKNLTVREMYTSISDTDFIVQLFAKGLAMNNDRLAVSAMEELIRRGDTDRIVYTLDEAFAKNLMVMGSPLTIILATSLFENAREEDAILSHYGKALRKGEFMGPTAWITSRAGYYQRFYLCGAVRRAKSWSKPFVTPADKLEKTSDQEPASEKCNEHTVDSLQEFIANLD